MLIIASVCIIHNLLGVVGRAGRGKEERWLHQGPEDEQGFVIKKKAFQAMGTTQARAWRKETTWCLWGLDVWVKRWLRMKVKMRPDQMVRSFKPDAKEFGSITEGTKVFRKEWFHKRWHYEIHFLTFFSGRKIFQVSTGCKNIYEKINSRTSWNNSKGPTGYESRKELLEDRSDSYLFFSRSLGHGI